MVDFFGALASLTCAIHCLCLPLLISVGLMNSTHHGHTFDFVMLSIGIVFAIYALRKSFLKHHNWSPIVIALLGFAVLISGIFMHNPIVSTAGGLIITYSHYRNYKLSSCKVSS